MRDYTGWGTCVLVTFQCVRAHVQVHTLDAKSKLEVNRISAEAVR